MTLIRQRLVVILAIVLAGMVYLWGLPAWRSPDGVAGATLLYSASPLVAIVWAIVLTAGVSLIAAAAAAQARVLHGAVVLGVGLLLPAVRGGTIDDWLRTAHDSSGYWLMAIESLLWTFILAGALIIVAVVAQFLRARCARAFDAPHEPVDSPEAVNPQHRHGPVTLAQTMGGLAVTIVAGSILSLLLVRTSDAGQVVMGLGLAFGLGAAIAWQGFPAAHPLAILLAPTLTAAGWYAWAAVSGGDSTAMLLDYFGGSFTHAGLALPIHYASAALAGAGFGLLWSQSLRLADSEMEPAGA